MNKNYLTQVVWLVVLTIGILLVLSIIPPIDIRFTTRQIDILSSLKIKPERASEEAEFLMEDSTIIALTSTPADTTASLASGSTIQHDSIARPTRKVQRKAGDITLIEDYSATGNGMENLIRSIENIQSSGRTVRIAFLGDSFIEADILTQNIREALQELYGGCGVGYMAMHSDFPGFRHSIIQSDNGWKTHSVAHDEQVELSSLPMQLYRAQGEAVTILKGCDKLRHIDHWDITTLGFIAEDTATISIKTDSTTHYYEVSAHNEAQFISIPQPTSEVEIRCNNSQVAVWGAWLDGTKGIAVDNISIRGYSGTSINTFPLQYLQQLNEALPHDLIVLQYGLNRMTPSVTDYSSYTLQLIDAIQHLRKAFPHTDILIMGIGDRCQNENGEIITMPAVYGMRKAQRKAAIATGCLFWDTYEAMKSLGGMPTFVDNKWAGKDYTHINHKGGATLAQEFIKAFNYAIKTNRQVDTRYTIDEHSTLLADPIDITIHPDTATTSHE